MDDYFTETIYDGSKICPGCGTLMNPITSAFAGPTGMCPTCRNMGYRKNLMEAMAKPR